MIIAATTTIIIAVVVYAAVTKGVLKPTIIIKIGSRSFIVIADVKIFQGIRL